jgi:hypothetical protein
VRELIDISIEMTLGRTGRNKPKNTNGKDIAQSWPMSLSKKR